MSVDSFKPSFCAETTGNNFLQNSSISPFCLFIEVSLKKDHDCKLMSNSLSGHSIIFCIHLSIILGTV